MDRLTRCTREWQCRSAHAGHALAVLAVWFRDFPDYLGRLLLIAFGGDIAERQDADQPLAAVHDRQPADLDIPMFLTTWPISSSSKQYLISALITSPILVAALQPRPPPRIAISRAVMIRHSRSS